MQGQGARTGQYCPTKLPLNMVEFFSMDEGLEAISVIQYHGRDKCTECMLRGLGSVERADPQNQISRWCYLGKMT
jgi:hypothetical protein